MKKLTETENFWYKKKMHSKLYFPIFVLVILFPFFFLFNQKGFSFFHKSFSRKSQFLGNVIGIIGYTFLILALVFSNRSKTLDRFFGGLDKVYHFHHRLGMAAFVFIFLFCSRNKRSCL